MPLACAAQAFTIVPADAIQAKRREIEAVSFLKVPGGTDRLSAAGESTPDGRSRVGIFDERSTGVTKEIPMYIERANTMPEPIQLR